MKNRMNCKSYLRDLLYAGLALIVMPFAMTSCDKDEEVVVEQDPLEVLKAEAKQLISEANEKMDTATVLSQIQSRMVAVEGGTFTMGAEEVTLADYYIGKYEVTQAEWKAIMGQHTSRFEKYLDVESKSEEMMKEIVRFFGADRPMIFVTHAECLAFVDTLNNILQNDTLGKYTDIFTFSADSVRLATEAEWEYAARGGNKSMGTVYAGSNEIDQVAWYDRNAGSYAGVESADYGLHFVGKLAANELGLYDMSGNVAEWCRDAWKEGDDTEDSKHVIRGGGWNNGADICSVTHRQGSTTAGNNIGLRLVWVKKNTATE